MDEIARSLGLPPREVFPTQMPRYPNMWFYVPMDKALRREHAWALRLLDRFLDERLELRDSFHDDVGNPGLLRLIGEPGEGSDYQARIGPLEPWPGDGADAPAHSHQLHARFYVSALARAGLHRARLSLGGIQEDCFCVASSVHFEVATEEPSHPYVDSCPVCGLTGAYALAIDRSSQDYCLRVHDPLGVELLLDGKVRGATARWPDGRAVTGLRSLVGEPGVRFEEQSPGPYGCTRVARVLIGAGGRSR